MSKQKPKTMQQLDTLIAILHAKLEKEPDRRERKKIWDKIDSSLDERLRLMEVHAAST